MVAHPTFILALGDLGREIAGRLASSLVIEDQALAANLVLASVQLDESEEALDREIVARLDEEPGRGASSEPSRPGPARITLSAPLTDESRLRLGDFVREQARRLLTLDHLLEYAPAADTLRPRMSVFIAADLGEAPVRAVLGPVIEVVTQTILSRFSHIFAAESMSDPGRNFGVHPLLFLGGLRDEAEAHRRSLVSALMDLDRLADRSSTWWAAGSGPKVLSRIVLFDDQTERYLLTRDQVISSVTAFLLLFLHSVRPFGTGDGTWPLAEFLGAGPDVSSQGRFAIFGAATLDLSRARLRQYVESRLGLALVRGMRPSEPDEPIGLSLRHLWHAGELDARLARPTDMPAEQSTSAERIDESLRRLAEELSGRCQDVTRADSPERIANDKYSWPWFEDIARTFTDRCRDLEERLLPPAAEEIDRAGLAMARSHFQELQERVDRWVWSGPAGWHRARQHLQELRTQVRREAASIRSEADLPEVPDPAAVRSAVLDLRHLAERWPRARRLWGSAALVTFILVALFQFLPKWLYVRFRYENHEYVPRPKTGEVLSSAGSDAASGRLGDAARKAGEALSSQYAEDPEAPEGFVRLKRYDPPSWLANPMLFELPPSARTAHYVVDRPFVFLYLTLLFGLLVAYSLHRYWRRLEREMHEAIRALRHRLEELASGPRDSAKAYFDARIRFSRDLWTRKLLAGLADQVDEEIERLNRIDEALVAQESRFRQTLEAMGVQFVGSGAQAEDLSGMAGKDSDPIYRRLLDPELVRTSYQAVVENEGARVTEYFDQFAERPEGLPDWRRNPAFVLDSELNRYCAVVTEGADRLLDPVPRLIKEALSEEGEAGRRLTGILLGFLSELTSKLGHAVELAASPEKGETRLVLVPEDQAERITEALPDLLARAGLSQAHASLFQVVPSSDADRIHLFVGWSGLRLGQFRFLRPAQDRGKEGAS